MSLDTKRRELEAGLLNDFQSLGGSRSVLNASLPNSNQLRKKIFYSTYIDTVCEADGGLELDYQTLAEFGDAVCQQVKKK